MRNAFVKQLVKQASANKNIILLTADLGYTVFEDYQKKLPKQFCNVGVAEANMIGIATGLALSGKTVLAYSIASFATLKTVEQIRNDTCVHNAHVIIVGSGSGFSYSNSGPTHHTLEDLAIMRTLPNLTIFFAGRPAGGKMVSGSSFKAKNAGLHPTGKKGRTKSLFQKTKTGFRKARYHKAR